MFRIVASLTAGVCLILFVIFIVFPENYVSTYGVSPDPSAAFVVRRASPMFAGLALILWMCRDVAPSTLRTALGVGLAVIFGGIALTGIAEFRFGTANAAILVAATGELLIAALFLIAIRRR